MAAEIWKPIKDFEELYEVSNLGRVRSLPRKQSKKKQTKEKILKPLNAKGNLYMQLFCTETNLSTTFPLGKLVAETFVPNPNQRTKIRYKDGNKSNCAADNLEWCEPQQTETMKSKCRYCGSPVRQERATICATCHNKKDSVHRLWLICQEIKRVTGKKV